MLVNKISPAPKDTPFKIHSIQSIPVSFLPPSMYTFQPEPSFLRLASTASTIHWFPKRLLASLIKSGLRIAALFKLTLSAPAINMSRTSSIVEMPPPTVKGI